VTGQRKLAIEAVVIFGLTALTAFLIYHFVVHTIRNPRPLGGANVDVSAEDWTQSEASFAIDPARPRFLFGATNDTGGETVRIAVSRDGGATWRRSDGPPVPNGCAHGEPRVAIMPGGREVLAFLAAGYCSATAITPYLVVTSRAGPDARWSPLVRITPKAWKYGFDDAPDLAVDERTGRLSLAWTRGLSGRSATVVVSTSSDAGRTWSAPRPASTALAHAHQASVAGGYVAGIAAQGLWVASGRHVTTVPLRANPAAGCALAAGSPLPREEETCAGPDPTLLVRRDRVFVVYDDVGADRTPDVYVAAFDRGLRHLFTTRVNPPDRGAAQQFFPAAAVDPTTGVLWACWYDSTFDPQAHRVWFTCSASHGGRTWTPPERAASVPSQPVDLFSAPAVIPSVVARDGVAHAFWTDGRVINLAQDVFTAALPERAAFSH
jgi:hypothetical protein